MTLPEFNQLIVDEAQANLLTTCHASHWAEAVVSGRPYDSLKELVDFANSCWAVTPKEDVLAAFLAHPKIGEKKSLAAEYKNTSAWASHEQRGVDIASENTLDDLAKNNASYEKKYGYIFIVCATGKSAEEMLTILLGRIYNDADEEFEIAKEEQRKIMNLRLEKMFL